MMRRVTPISILMIASAASAAPVAHRASLMDGSISSADYPPAAIAAHQVGNAGLRDTKEGCGIALGHGTLAHPGDNVQRHCGLLAAVRSRETSPWSPRRCGMS